MEKLYQYLWQHRMLGRRLSLRSGIPVEIIHPGVLNRDAGPDFSRARIRIGDTDWCGNVEIHVKASDWFRHGHHQDPAYNGVALHVVAIDDGPTTSLDGRTIPQTAVSFPESFYHIYASLADHNPGVRCAGHINKLSGLTVCDWLETLTMERMHLKAERILEEYRLSTGDWQRVCFITLARALGFGLNSDPFEMMARSLPLNYIGRHSDSLFQIEALLFGQAGMLDMSVNIFDEYYQGLCREYYFLARKYGLRPLRPGIWKYARTRPGNFPHRRIALLARFLQNDFSLLDKILASHGDPEKCRLLFDEHLSGYWASHHDFGRDETPSPAALSKSSIDLLLINFVAPLLFAYGRHVDDPDMAHHGLDLWTALPPENNVIIRGWKSLGLPVDNASRSQALLQLRKQYCDADRCLDCRFGHSLLRRSVTT